MPIDASRNPYDSPRFDTGGGKAVSTDEPGKRELDDDLDDALDDLGAGTKGPVDTDDTDDGDDLDLDLDLAGTGTKGEVDLDDLGEPDVKALGGDIGDDLDDDAFSSLKGDDAIDDLDLGDAADGGGAFSADLGEVPDVSGKDSLGEDDDSSLFEQKGSILDGVAEEMKGGLDDDADDVDF